MIHTHQLHHAGLRSLVRARYAPNGRETAAVHVHPTAPGRCSGEAPPGRRHTQPPVITERLRRGSGRHHRSAAAAAEGTARRGGTRGGERGIVCGRPAGTDSEAADMSDAPSQTTRPRMRSGMTERATKPARMDSLICMQSS